MLKQSNLLDTRVKTNVLMIIFDRTYPPSDIRVEIEAAVLSGKYNVFLLARRKSGEKYFGFYKGIYVLRMDQPFSKIRMFAFLKLRFILFLRLISFVLSYNIKILHVHDFPYSLPVTIFGKIFHRKVVFDMRENYVDYYVSGLLAGAWKQDVGLRVQLGRLWIWYMRMSEILTCKFATKVIVVVEEMAERLIKLGISKTKIVLVSNTPDLNQLKKFENDKLGRLFGNKFTVSYIGSFQYLRGLDTLIKAIPLLVKKNSNIHFLIVGDNSSVEKRNLEKLCEQLGVSEYVTFTGWVPFDKAMEYMQVSDMTVIPHHSTPHTNATIPYKIFQGMYFKKPVLVSDVKPLKRIVEETKCGAIFQAGNDVQLANAILKLVDDHKTLKAMGEAERKAVKNKYNWNVDGKRLVQLYSELR